jgi:hypothetical protein
VLLLQLATREETGACSEKKGGKGEGEGEKGGKGKGKKNNQGAQAADQGGLPGFGGINQAQTGESSETCGACNTRPLPSICYACHVAPWLSVSLQSHR